MTAGQSVAVLLAGLAAGTINAVVGSGTLVTFPALLAVGLPPLTANVTNVVGLLPGSVAGAVGYRRELRGQERRAVRLGAAALLGTLTGAALLLNLPSGAFEAVVPFFVAIALLSILVQPLLSRRLEARRPAGREPGAGLTGAVFATGTYGGYFGAAQGILLLGVLGAGLPEDLQRVNAVKNVVAAVVNVVAGVVFLLAAPVAWKAAGLIAVGSLVGGWLGARYGRRLRPSHLRVVVLAVGVAALVQLVV